MDITLLYFDGCPNWKQTKADLTILAVEYELTLRTRAIDTAEAAERWQFRGSPTVLVDGVDPFTTPQASPGLACRLYRTPDGLSGSPTMDMLRSAIEHRS